MNIREIINQYRDKLRDTNTLTPEVAAKILVELSSLLGNLNEVLLERQMAFNDMKMQCLDEIKSVAKAVVKAETTKEYRDYQEVKGYIELTKEMIRGLKYYLRSSGDEYGYSKNI